MLSNNKEVKYLHLNMKPHEQMAVSASGHGEGCAGDLRAMSTVPIGTAVSEMVTNSW